MLSSVLSQYPVVPSSSAMRVQSALVCSSTCTVSPSAIFAVTTESEEGPLCRACVLLSSDAKAGREVEQSRSAAARLLRCIINFVLIRACMGIASDLYTIYSIILQEFLFRVNCFRCFSVKNPRHFTRF